MLGVTGELRGRALFVLEKSLAVSIANSMLGKSAVPELDALGRSALSEMTNMITGRAVSILSEKGFDVDFSPQACFEGREVKIPETDVQSILVPFKTQYGSLELNLALKEKN